jgi:hypothetical protein
LRREQEGTPLKIGDRSAAFGPGPAPPMTNATVVPVKAAAKILHSIRKQPARVECCCFH